MYAAKIISFLKQKNYLLYFFILAIFFIFYSLTVNQIKSYNDLTKERINSFVNSKNSHFQNV